MSDMRDLTCISAISAMLLTISGCSEISLGTATVNDAAPTGTVVAQGDFSGANGRTVSGAAIVYLTSSGTTCTYTVRLQNLSAPTDSGLQLLPVVNGATSVTPSLYVLRGATGNQNYAFTDPGCQVSWTQIQINNPALSPTTAQAYGYALLRTP